MLGVMRELPDVGGEDGDGGARVVTIAQLLARPALAEATLVGGAAGTQRVVTDVVMVSARSRPSADPALEDVLLVLGNADEQADTYYIDIALRTAHDSGVSGVLVSAVGGPPPLAATRLADKWGLPLLTVPVSDLLPLADQLRQVVAASHVVRSQVLLRVVDELRRAPQSTGMDPALSTLSANLDGQVALLGQGGTVVAGSPLGEPPVGSLGDRPTVVTDDGHVDVVQPLQLAPRERASFWLVCRLHDPTPTWRDLVGDALAVACWYVATRLVAERLERERDARFRLGVLNAVLAGSSRPDGALMRQLGVMGWRVDAWCSGIHLATSGDSDALTVLTRTEELTHLLEAAGVHGAIVERADGWSMWLSDDTEPATVSYRRTVDRVREAVEAFVARSPGVHVHVGIGRPYQGLVGLRKSLEEAQEAATIARASGSACEVRHIDEMGLRRILVGWYTSDSFAELAHTLLTPVLQEDRAEELLQTLETYLDCESSATQAAALLNLHRNTVINRIERLRSLLTADLDDSDERLAVQLACRVVKLKRSAV